MRLKRKPVNASMVASTISDNEARKIAMHKVATTDWISPCTAWRQLVSNNQRYHSSVQLQYFSFALCRTGAPADNRKHFYRWKKHRGYSRDRSTENTEKPTTLVLKMCFALSCAKWRIKGLNNVPRCGFAFYQMMIANSLRCARSLASLAIMRRRKAFRRLRLS